MLKNAIVYRIGKQDPEELLSALETRRHAPIGTQEASSVGFVAPYDGGELVHEIEGGFLVLKVRSDTKRPPASAVNEKVREWLKRAEEMQGYKPGRKQTKEIKEQVIDTLMATTIPTTRYTNVYITPRYLVIDSASRSTADTVISLLAKAYSSVNNALDLTMIYTKQAPTHALTDWVFNEEPDGFTVDNAATLENQNSHSVKIKGMAVQSDEVRQHIKAGKYVTRLALTHADRVSFELDSILTIRRFELLDILKENRNDSMSADDSRDALIAITLSELGLVMLHLITAMGGERE